MESFDSTKTGNYKTMVREELLYVVNWDKIKTFEDFITLAKSGIIKTNTIRESDLKNKHKEIKKFLKTTGSKVLVIDSDSDKKK